MMRWVRRLSTIHLWENYGRKTYLTRGPSNKQSSMPGDWSDRSKFKNLGRAYSLLCSLPNATWNFEQNVMVLKRISETEQPSETALDSTYFWARVYDLLLDCEQIAWLHGWVTWWGLFRRWTIETTIVLWSSCKWKCSLIWRYLWNAVCWFVSKEMI